MKKGYTKRKKAKDLMKVDIDMNGNYSTLYSEKICILLRIIYSIHTF